jgi:hypothetical protein
VAFRPESPFAARQIKRAPGSRTQAVLGKPATGPRRNSISSCILPAVAIAVQFPSWTSPNGDFLDRSMSTTKGLSILGNCARPRCPYNVKRGAQQSCDLAVPQ